MSAAPDPLEKKTVEFENGGNAEFIHVKQAVKAEEVLNVLGMAAPVARAAIIVAGSATPFPTQLENRLIDLLGRGVVQAAQDTQAIVLDQGTKAGVSALLGQAVADRIVKLQMSAKVH